MNTEKFTPGEWKTVLYISWFGSPAILIHNKDDGEIAIVNYHKGSNGTMEKANAALISAAPEMFDRLKRTESDLLTIFNPNISQQAKERLVEIIIENITSVLKKARGEE